MLSVAPREPVVLLLLLLWEACVDVDVDVHVVFPSLTAASAALRVVPVTLAVVFLLFASAPLGSAAETNRQLQMRQGKLAVLLGEPLVDFVSKFA